MKHVKLLITFYTRKEGYFVLTFRHDGRYGHAIFTGSEKDLHRVLRDKENGVETEFVITEGTNRVFFEVSEPDDKDVLSNLAY